MHSQRSRALPRRAGTALLAPLLLLAGLTPWAAAQQAPTPEGKGIILAEPGVAFVRTSVSVSIRLTYADRGKLSGVSALDAHYNFPYATGSGFVVTPNGAVVTASHVVEPVEQEVRNYAANRLFFGDPAMRRLGYSLAGRDPFRRYTLKRNIPVPPRAAAILNGILQDCYRAVACRFGIRRSFAVYSPVQIAGIQAPKGTPARLLKSTGFAATDVAVLKVDGTNLPTVVLGDTADRLETGDSLSALGYAGSARDLPTGETEPTKAFGKVSSIRPVGDSKQIQADVRAEPGMSGGPVLDADGKVIGLTSYARLDNRGQTTNAYVRTVDDIADTLRSAAIKPARGRVDQLYAQAMASFWDHHYSVAVPQYQEILNLYDGHPQAKRYLAQAQAKVGTAEELPLTPPKRPSQGPGALPIVLVILLVALAGGAGLLFLRRRRAAPAGPAGTLPGDGMVAGNGAAGAPLPEADREGLPAGPAPAPVTRATPVPAEPTGAGEPARLEGGATVGFQPAEQPPGEPATKLLPRRTGPKFCASCGSALKPGGKFCSECGTRFG
jgi:serine protease Do